MARVDRTWDMKTYRYYRLNEVGELELLCSLDFALRDDALNAGMVMEEARVMVTYNEVYTLD